MKKQPYIWTRDDMEMYRTFCQPRIWYTTDKLFQIPKPSAKRIRQMVKDIYKNMSDEVNQIREHIAWMRTQQNIKNRGQRIKHLEQSQQFYLKQAQYFKKYKL